MLISFRGAGRWILLSLDGGRLAAPPSKRWGTSLQLQNKKAHKRRTVSDAFSVTQQWLVHQRGWVELTRQARSSTHLCADFFLVSVTMTEQTKKSSMATDDETSKFKSKEKETNLMFRWRQTVGKSDRQRGKTRVTIGVTLKEHWKKKRDWGEVQMWLSLSLTGRYS